jgi:Restriction endonuclease
MKTAEQDKRGALLARLADADEDDPAFLAPSELDLLSAADVPEHARISIGTLKDGIHHIEWDGALSVDRGKVLAYGRYVNTRKYWYSPVGLYHYMDLVRRAIELRARTRGDISLDGFDDDGAYIQLAYTFAVPDGGTLRAAYDCVLRLQRELEEAVEHAGDEVGRMLSDTEQRVSGWGSQPLDALVNAVETSKSTDDKGRSLEELMARLFSSIAGFQVTDRVRTETEEIDLTILNGNTDPRFTRADALLLVECKNWSSNCGKNEFVIFKEKVENRSQRCSLGFLVSWNGFAQTVTKEMLRGSRERTLIVPITGEQVRRAVRTDQFANELHAAWQAAVQT